MAASSAATPQNGTADAIGDTEKEAYKCPVVLVVGMAGSGKTTLVDTFSAWLEDEDEAEEEESVQAATGDTANASDTIAVGSTSASSSSSSKPPPGKQVEGAAASSLKPGNNEQIRAAEPAADGESSLDDLLPGEDAYVVNLDPAVLRVPYEPNIDIRDTIDYKSVMSEYTLGPNGGILTSLNLYATRFDQVLSLVERRSEEVRCVLLDTPGQIETFTWSASGTIITESLAQTLPTCVLFVVDVPRASSPMTFVSSMLYACSIMYKTRLPMIICLNKADIAPEKAREIGEWIEDFDKFDERLREENSGFVDELARSMALALEEFYAVIKSTIISAHTGAGMKDLAGLIREAAEEYNREYKPWMEEQRKIKREIQEEDTNGQIERLKKDIETDKKKVSGRQSSFAPKTEDELKEIEEEIEAEEKRKEELKNADPEEIEAYNNFVDYLDNLEIKNSSSTEKKDSSDQ